MRILYIDQYFSTRKGRSGTRGYEFARRFVKAGHAVTVIASASRYSDLMGQKSFLRRLDVEGVTVFSLRIDYGQKMSYPRRAFSFISFMAAAILLGATQGRHDIVFASSTPLSVGVAGAIIAWLRGLPFVFEVRDLWPEAPVEMGLIRNPALIEFLKMCERWIYRRAEKINALSPGMADGIAACGISRERISMVPNGCDPDLLPAQFSKAAARKRLGLSARDFFIVYAGALGPANGLDDLLLVARSLKEKGIRRAHFLIVGEGSDEERLCRLAAQWGLDNVEFLGVKSRAETAEIIACSDLGATVFAPLPVLATCSPNKLFDYLALGVPQMVNTPGWMREIVEGGGAGFYWPHGEPDAAAEQILRLMSDAKSRARMGRTAKALALRDFDRGLLADRLLSVFYESAAQPRGGLPILFQGALDRTLALLALIVLSPVFIAFYRAIRHEDGGPSFYRTRRIGVGGRSFLMTKFRTMRVDAEKIGLGLNVVAGDDRITRVGHFLREWSLDELPQLFNVLTGEMRLVGPRPALPEHAERYNSEQRRRLRVRPGLTGWAQVNGRNRLDWNEKLRLDTWYADNRSFLLDLKILLKTFRVVISREGLYEKDAGLNDTFNRFETH